MTLFRIHMINSHFESCETGEYTSLEAAFKAGISGASRVATEAIAEGHDNSAVEIRIEQDDHIVARRILTFSVSDLLAGKDPPEVPGP